MHTFHPIGSIFEPQGILSLAVTTSFIVLSIIALNKNKTVSLILLLIGLPLLPALYIPGLSQLLENAFAERYLYLPSFGFVLLAALPTVWVRIAKLNRRGALGAALILLVGFYCVGVIHRNKVWKDSYSLFADTVKKSPESVVSLEELGYALLTKGRIDEAIKQLEIAIVLRPNYANAHLNLGFAYASKGWIDGAIEAYKIGLKLERDKFIGHNNLGAAYDAKGLLDEAIEEYRIAIALKPDWADPYNNLGVACAKKGLIDKAIEDFQIAIWLKPNELRFRENLAKAYNAKRNR